MFVYQGLYSKMSNGDWKGAILPTPFYNNLYMPFNEADNLEITDVALNHLLIQRDDVSIYSSSKGIVPIRREPANISHVTISKRNEFTEFNGDMNGTTEGGDLSFGGEAIEAVILRRSSSRSKFHIWEDIAVIPVTTTSLYTLDKIVYDPYVEHGITYQYAIQPVGSIGRGSQFETLKNMAVYDDIWLIGSDVKQLMMGYNPVVSGYKYIVKDAAVETIGSKYPYVIRNANVGYTQFQFSCTITAHMNLINDKETFTPFVDIEVLDEYKDIIVSDSGGSNADGSLEDIPERPYPKPQDQVDILPDSEIRTNERAEDSTNKVVYVTIVGEPYFNVLEDNLPGGVVKIQMPIERIQTQGLVDIEQMARNNGTYDMYVKWRDGYDTTIYIDDPDNPGQVIPTIQRVDGHNWVPMFVDKIDTREVALLLDNDPEVQKEIAAFKFESTTRADSFVFEGVRNIKKKAYELKTSSNRVFDPAYPSSPETTRFMDTNATVVSSDKEFMLEREFRRRVMEFLHDGQPKIFKSPTEGLLLVKLSDINMTPNTTLGRMIYDFSCTCTEIGKVNPESLAKYGFREAVGDLLISKGSEFETEMNEQEAKQLYELFRT